MVSVFHDDQRTGVASRKARSRLDKLMALDVIVLVVLGLAAAFAPGKDMWMPWALPIVVGGCVATFPIAMSWWIRCSRSTAGAPVLAWTFLVSVFAVSLLFL